MVVMFALPMFRFSSAVLSWIGASVRRALRLTMLIELPVGAGVADLHHLITINIRLAPADPQFWQFECTPSGLFDFITPSRDRRLAPSTKDAGLAPAGNISSRYPHPPKHLEQGVLCPLNSRS